MHIRRCDDGANSIEWFIWSRHPRWSLTWTHSLWASWSRANTDERPINLVKMRKNTGHTYLFKLWRLKVSWHCQHPVPRTTDT
jgi:hypothetical protein